jgi:putative thioredoxin
MTFIDGASPAPELVKNGSDQAFMADVIEASRETPVIVDFWAPWCGPCKTLAPMLEAAVRKANGAVKLVKINIDEHPAVAGQLGVRSIPAVYAFDKGRPVDGFMGAIPDSQIKLFVDRLAGAGSEQDVKALLEQAAESLKLGDIGGAAQSFMAVLQIDQYNTKAIAGMARIALEAGEPEQAREILAQVPADKADDADIAGVRAALELGANPRDESESSQLKAKVDANPNDFQARFDFANALAGGGDLEGAVDQLIAIIAKQRDWNEDAARQQLFKIFEAAGPMSEVTKLGRRKLSAILFS